MKSDGRDGKISQLTRRGVHNLLAPLERAGYGKVEFTLDTWAETDTK